MYFFSIFEKNVTNRNCHHCLLLLKVSCSSNSRLTGIVLFFKQIGLRWTFDLNFASGKKQWCSALPWWTIQSEVLTAQDHQHRNFVNSEQMRESLVTPYRVLSYSMKTRSLTWRNFNNFICQITPLNTFQELHLTIWEVWIFCICIETK